MEVGGSGGWAVAVAVARVDGVECQCEYEVRTNPLIGPFITQCRQSTKTFSIDTWLSRVRVLAK